MPYAAQPTNILTLNVDMPILNPNSIVKHNKTYWQLSTTPDFTSGVLLIDDNSATNLYSYQYTLTEDYTGTLYARTKYVLSQGESNWSSIVAFDSNTGGVKLSYNIIATPTVTYDLDLTSSVSGRINITSSDFRMFVGAGSHKSTTWYIKDVDGNVLFKRKNDTVNLTSLSLDLSDTLVNKIYLITVVHNSVDGNTSNTATAIFNIYTNESDAFTLTTPYPLVPNRWLYFVLKLYTSKFKYVDIVIKDDTGNVVASELNQTSMTPRVLTGPLLPHIQYTIYARIQYLDGTYSKYQQILTSVITDNTLIDFNTAISYLEKYDYVQPMNMGGTVIQSSYQFYTGLFLLANNRDNNIYRYTLSGERLTRTGVAFQMNGVDKPFDKPFFNFVALYSGRLLVDFATDITDVVYRRSRFDLYDYNTITNEFTLVNSLERPNERYSTGMSASLGITDITYVYYIPTLEYDNLGNEVNLNLKRLNVDTLELTVVCTLPFLATRYVSLVVLDSDNLLVFGGSNGFDTIASDKVHYRSNDNLYKYTISTNKWTKVGTIINNAPISKYIYNFQAYMRRDGNIVAFPSIENGPDLANQNSLLINTSTFVCTYENNDHEDTMTYLNSVVTRSGDIYRLSSATLDPQKVYNYVSNTVATVTDNATDNNSLNLVVPAGKIVTIEDIYKFNTISIAGTSYDDTGALHWIDGETLRVFQFRDLIVIGEDVIINSDIDNSTWDSINIFTPHALSFTTADYLLGNINCDTVNNINIYMANKYNTGMDSSYVFNLTVNDLQAFNDFVDYSNGITTGTDLSLQLDEMFTDMYGTRKTCDQIKSIS